MFLVVNNDRIFRVRGNRLTLGKGPDVSVCIQGSGIQPIHCEMLADDSGRWSVRNLSTQTVLLNLSPVPQGAAMEIEPPCELRCSPNVIEVRAASAATTIPQRLREKAFEIESEVLNQVLEKLRHSPAALGSREERERIEAELDRQFKSLPIEPDVEKYLAIHAVTEFLVNRINGYGIKGESKSEDQKTAGSNRYSSFLDQLEHILGLSEDNSLSEQIERSEVLVPWLFQSRSDLTPPSKRRELAISLLREHLIDLMFGLGPLDDLIKAPDINDIMVLPSGQIFIERSGQMQDSGRKMLSAAVSRRIVERIMYLFTG